MGTSEERGNNEFTEKDKASKQRTALTKTEPRPDVSIRLSHEAAVTRAFCDVHCQLQTI